MAEKDIIPIYSLSGGVSRQPDSKRTPYQAENLDNCMISVERSAEKRPGFSVLSGVGEVNLSFLPPTMDPHFTWYQLDRQNRYLIIIDRNATGNLDTIMYVIKVTETGWTNLTPESQWDPEDPALQWDGLEAITDQDIRHTIFQYALDYVSDDDILTRYNFIKSRGLVDIDTRGYLCYDEGNTREILKSLQIGPNIYYLNTKAYAGFTSGLDGQETGLNGKSIGTTDTVGGKITYYTATTIVKTSDGRMYAHGYSPREGETLDPSWEEKFIPVEDYVYGDFEKPWLGQSVANFGNLRFPPDTNDFVANNTNLTTGDDSARLMLAEYYDPDSPYYDEIAETNPVDGRGKIYYCDAPYLSLDAGYYRIISFPEGTTNTDEGLDGMGKPYTQKVRTPDYCSVIDAKRMPQLLSYANGIFRLGKIDWEPRTVGTRETNPGPSPFLDGDLNARHVQITAISNFRDRLIMSVGDVVFTSQLGVFTDLWIKDPSNVVTSDPIDIRASSATYAEITSMLPYNQYLFINTKGGVQFELKGDNNLISPLTAEISSTTFYSTADLVDPQQMGSQIFFLDKQRLYIYLNQDAREFNTAVDLSSTVRGYLPTNYQDVTVGVAQNYLICVDEDNKNHLYIYCNRFDGKELLQSAFWRYILADNEAVYGCKAWDNYLYCVVKKEDRVWNLTNTLLEQESLSVPRLDSRSLFTITDMNTGCVGVESTLAVPYLLGDDCYVVLTDDFNDAGIYKASSVVKNENTTTVVVPGIDLTEHVGKSIWIGSSYSMVIELSQLYSRRQDNNILEGTVNLKTLLIRHVNTGSYRVEVTRRGRPDKLVSEFSATNLEDELDLETDGKFIAKIFGVADEVTIQIINDTVTPCNITQMEARAIFNRNTRAMR